MVGGKARVSSSFISMTPVYGFFFCKSGFEESAGSEEGYCGRIIAYGQILWLQWMDVARWSEYMRENEIGMRRHCLTWRLADGVVPRTCGWDDVRRDSRRLKTDSHELLREQLPTRDGRTRSLDSLEVLFLGVSVNCNRALLRRSWTRWLVERECGDIRAGAGPVSADIGSLASQDRGVNLLLLFLFALAVLNVFLNHHSFHLLFEMSLTSTTTVICSRWRFARSAWKKELIINPYHRVLPLIRSQLCEYSPLLYTLADESFFFPKILQSSTFISIPFHFLLLCLPFPHLGLESTFACRSASTPKIERAALKTFIFWGLSFQSSFSVFNLFAFRGSPGTSSS